jgi:hypothetical protein
LHGGAIEMRLEAFEQILTAMMIATPGFDEAKFRCTLQWMRDRFRENNPESRLAAELDRFLQGPLARDRRQLSGAARR